MSRRTTIGALLGTKPAPRRAKFSSENSGADTEKFSPENSATPPPDRPRSGAMRAMESVLSGLAAQVEEGAAIVDLDPALVDGSFVPDRVLDPTDQSLADLAASIRERGQINPILVRRHPEQKGRYQIAFGHRRARATAVLGIPVRAVIKALTDEELVVAQGKENAERRDLSYIERAFFALRLERRDFPRDVIGAALGIQHKGNLSTLISVANGIPDAVVEAIGPAPAAGRPRWVLLADRIAVADQRRLASALVDPALVTMPTDERFSAVLSALSPPAQRSAKPKVWKDAAGRSVARIEKTESRYNLSIDRKLEPEFGDYLVERLPEILAAFKAGKA